MGMTLEQATAAKRVLRWLGVKQYGSFRAIDEDMVVDALMCLAKPADLKLQTSTDREDVRLAAGRVHALMAQAAERDDQDDDEDEDEEVADDAGPWPHKIPVRTRVTVFPNKPENSEDDYDAVIERHMPSAADSPSPKYLVRKEHNGAIHTVFEHQIISKPGTGKWKHLIKEKTRVIVTATDPGDTRVHKAKVEYCLPGRPEDDGPTYWLRWPDGHASIVLEHLLTVDTSPPPPTKRALLAAFNATRSEGSN